MMRARTPNRKYSTVKLNLERLEDRLAPAILVQSTFDTGDDGWRIGEFFSNAGDTAPTFLAADGNPGGAIRTTDIAGVTAFQAPAAFLGDQSAAYGGTLHLEQRLLTPNTPQFPMALLSDGTLFLQFRTPQPSTAWTTYDLPLVASAGWEVSNLSDTADADPPASEAQLQQVLGNLAVFNLRADWRTGADQVDLDNVRLESADGPDLEVTIAVAPDPATAGATLTYTITVTNHGPGNAVNPTVATAVPARTTFVSFTPLAGGTTTTPAVGGTGAIASTMPLLVAGTSASFLMVVQVTASGDAAVIQSSASVASDLGDPDPANNNAGAATILYGTVRWNADSDGLWTDPANWDSGFVPRPGDNVIIDRPDVEIAVTIPEGDFAIAGLNSQETLIIAGGSSLTLTKGSQLSGLDIQVDAELIFDTADPVNNIAGDWNNAGRIAWIGSGSLLFSGGANLNNLAGGIFEIHTAEPAGLEPTMLAIGEGGRLYNQSGGIIDIDHPEAGELGILADHRDIVTFDGRFDNDGVLAIRAGKLTLTYDAVLTNQAGGVIRFAAHTAIDNALGFGQVYNLTGGLIEEDPAAPGRISITARFDNQGTVRASDLTLWNGVNTGRFEVSGEVGFGGRRFDWNNGTLVGAGAILIAPIEDPSGAAVLYVNGNLNLSNLAIEHRGVISVHGGTLTINDGYNDGRMAGTVNFVGDFIWNTGQWNGGVEFTGSIRIDPPAPANGIVRVYGNVTLTSLDIGRYGAIQVSSIGSPQLIVAGLINNAGTLSSAGHIRGAVRNSGTLSSAGTIRGEVRNFGTLSARGMIYGNVYNAGVISPNGSLRGILTIEGNYTQTAAGSLVIDIRGREPGTEHDQLRVTGRTKLAGRLQVVYLNKYRPRSGDSFRVLRCPLITGNVQINKPGLRLSANGFLIRQ